MPTDAPDPMGKRALFWAPAERDEDGPRRPGEREVAGKHALFSDEARATAGGPSPRARPGSSRPGSSRPGRVAAPAAPGAGGGQRRLLNPITVECSSCAARTDIHVTEFVVLHLPVWLWRPGRGYRRFMTCPACRRRTWVSASWAPWSH